MHANWKSCTLGDVLTLQRGFDLPERERHKGKVPIVSSSGTSGSHNIAKVHAPGVVTGRYGTLGEVFYIKEDFWPLNTTLYVRDFKNNNPLFLSYFLRTLNLARQNGAGAVPGLNRNALHLLSVHVPPPPTQQKIASILSAYDDLIENNTRRIAILEEVAQALYREWFVHFRFPGHEKNKMVDSVLGMIPEGWDVVKVGDASISVNRGISPKYDNLSDSLVLNQRCIRNGKLNLEEARKHITKVLPEKLVRFGDVVINSTGTGTLGRVTQIYQNISDCTVDSHVTIVRPGNEVAIDYFGLTLINLQAHFESLGVGSTGQTELSRASIASANFLLPPKDLQEIFSTLISPMRKNIIQALAKNATLRRTRDLLLPKLISGEIDVEGLDIGGEEMAEVIEDKGEVERLQPAMVMERGLWGE